MLFASSLCITILLSGKTYAFVDLECYIYMYTFLDNKQYNKQSYMSMGTGL